MNKFFKLATGFVIFSLAQQGVAGEVESSTNAHLLGSTGLVTGLTTLHQTEAGQKVLDDNLAVSIAVNNNATKEQQQQALYDNTLLALLGSMSNGLLVADALGGTMKDVFFENVTIEIDPNTYQNVGKSFSKNFTDLFTQVNLMVSLENDFAKQYFANGLVNGEPVLDFELPEGGIFGAYDTAYQDQINNGGRPNGHGNARPVQVDPDSIITFEGTDFFGQNASSQGDAISTIQNSPAYPSGHSAFGFASTLLFALMVPERYQEFMLRGAEYGNSRVVLGVHYGLDVVAARIMTTHAVAQMMNNNPDYLNQEIGMLGSSITTTDDFQQLFLAAQADLREMLETGCNSTIAECNQASGPKKTQEERDREREAYRLSLTYGLDPVGDTTLEAVVPEGAEILIATRYPYLSKEQRREILRTTMIESGHALDDGSGWARLNLYDAAGGYGDLAGETVVNMDASRGGLDAYDEWNNHITGVGSLEKQGTGVLELSGNSTFTGPTTISGGALIVSGSLVSDVAVKQDALLQGNGTIGALRVEAGGTVATSKDGALTVKGDVDFNQATYLLALDSQMLQNSEASSVMVTGIESEGAIRFHDSEVELSFTNPTGNLLQENSGTIIGKEITVLKAEEGIEGSLTLQESDYLFVSPEFNIDGDTATFKVDRNNVAFATYAGNQNQQNVANAIETLGAGNGLYESIVFTENARHLGVIYQQLSGKVYSDLKSATINESHHVRDGLLQRLLVSSHQDSAKAVWGKLYGSWGKTKDRDNMRGFSSNTQGMIFGIDSGWQNEMLFGASLGYSKMRFDSDEVNHKFDQHNYHLAVYGGWIFDQWQINGGMSYAWHKADVDRVVSYGQNHGRYYTDYKMRTTQLFADIGYKITLNDSGTITPFMNAAFVSVRNSGFNEEGYGQVAALTANSQRSNHFISTIGLRLNADFGQASKLSFNGEVGLQNQFGSLDRDLKLRFNSGGSEFAVQSISAARSTAVLKANLHYQSSENSVITFGYSGNWSNKHHDNSVNLGLKIAF